MTGRPPSDPALRFLKKTVWDGACLRWTGSFFRDGYGQFSWHNEDKSNWRAHRAAWRLFVGPIPDGMQVLHRCDHSWCVNFDGCLYCGTHDQNMADRCRAGHYPLGIENHKAKLTDDQIRSIRDRRLAGEHEAVLADEMGVSRGNIWNITNGKSWRHLEVQ